MLVKDIEWVSEEKKQIFLFDHVKSMYVDRKIKIRKVFRFREVEYDSFSALAAALQAYINPVFIPDDGSLHVRFEVHTVDDAFLTITPKYEENEFNTICADRDNADVKFALKEAVTPECYTKLVKITWR